MSHVNNGKCPGCLAIIDKYPGFFLPLRNWFVTMQEKHPNFHVANAGRGKADQEVFFARGASNAHWGQSAHNFNCALDTFFEVNGNYSLDSSLYASVVQNLDPDVCWYGAPDAVYKERPHFEWKSWRTLRDAGAIKLVE